MTRWQLKSYHIEVKAGETKVFCKCGLSKNPPFCDGSHGGSGVTPFVETFDQDKKIYVCGCGESTKMPYCDGTHKKIRAQEEAEREKKESL